MHRRRVFGVLQDLAVAMFNATLILLALCLWLAWQLSDTLSSAASEFASSLISVQPLREDVQSMTGEISALRNELASIAQSSGEVRSQAFRTLQERTDTLELRISGTMEKVETLVNHPERLIDYAIDQAAVSMKSAMSDMWQCNGTGITEQGKSG